MLTVGDEEVAACSEIQVITALAIPAACAVSQISSQLIPQTGCLLDRSLTSGEVAILLGQFMLFLRSTTRAGFSSPGKMNQGDLILHEATAVPCCHPLPPLHFICSPLCAATQIQRLQIPKPTNNLTTHIAGGATCQV